MKLTKLLDSSFFFYIFMFFTLLFLLISSVVGTRATLSSTDIVENSWVTKQSMHEARSGLRVAVINEKIYAIGGATQEGFSATIEEYDVTTNTWTFKAPMITARSDFGLAVYKNKIYCIGGYADGLATGVNEVYDPLTDSWETKSPMPTPRMNVQANLVINKIYLIGGSPAETVNEVYDPETDTWETKASPPTSVSSYASAVVDNKIYVITSNLNQIYDVKNDSWSHGAPSPYPVVVATAATTTGMFAPVRIFVFGVDADLPYWQLNFRNFTTQSYDPRTNNWMVCASMPTGRFDVGVAVVNDMIYVIGGYTTEFRTDVLTPNPLIIFSTVTEQYTPIDFGSVAPNVQVISPENGTYTSSNVSLVFTVNKPVMWTSYSIDGKETVTIIGNTTLLGLPRGVHNIIVYAKDEFENIGSSERIILSVAEQQEALSGHELEPFPTTFILTAVSTIIIVSVVFLFYFKIRRH